MTHRKQRKTHDASTARRRDWTRVVPYEVEGERLVEILSAGGFLALADAVSAAEFSLLLAGHARHTARRIAALEPIAEQAHRSSDQAMFDWGWDSPPHDAARAAANFIEQALTELRRRGAAL